MSANQEPRSETDQAPNDCELSEEQTEEVVGGIVPINPTKPVNRKFAMTHGLDGSSPQASGPYPTDEDH